MEITKETNKINTSGATEKVSTKVDSSVPQIDPNIFDYLNYREFLRDFYTYHKASNANFSYGTFANKGKFQTRNYLKRVIDGERSVLAENFPKFFKALGLSTKEAHYFETLVNYNQSKDAESKKYYFQMLKEAASGIKNSAVEICSDQYEMFSVWYVIPVFESLALTSVEHTAEGIAKNFRKKLSAKEVKYALELLVKAKLVDFNPDTNTYFKTKEEIKYTQSVVNLAIREFHKQTLSNAIEFIDNESIENRYLRSLTLSVSSKNLEEVYSEIDKLVKSLNAKYSNIKDDKTILMQLNLNILNLVKSKKEEKL